MKGLNTFWFFSLNNAGYNRWRQIKNVEMFLYQASEPKISTKASFLCLTKSRFQEYIEKDIFPSRFIYMFLISIASWLYYELQGL